MVINVNAVICQLPLRGLLWVVLVSLFVVVFNYMAEKEEAEAVHGTGLVVAS